MRFLRAGVVGASVALAACGSSGGGGGGGGGAPVVASFSPADGETVPTVPAMFTLTLSENVNAAGSAFSLAASTCATNPTVGAVTGADTSTITVPLTGGDCAEGDHVVLTVDMTQITADDGTPGSGSASASVFVDAVPELVSSVPADGSPRASVSTVALTFSKPVDVAAAAFDLSTSTCATAPTVASVTGSGSADVTLALAGGDCAAGDDVVVAIDMTHVVDAVGGTGSGDETISVSIVTPIIFLADPATGDLGGATGADALCASASANPHDGGEYKALVVSADRTACASPNCSGSGSAEHVDWVLLPNESYEQAGGSPIGTTNQFGLFEVPLTTGIAESSSDDTWTGLGSDWTTTLDTCNNWHGSDSGSAGTRGVVRETDITAFSDTAQTCNNLNDIYCVEQ